MQEKAYCSTSKNRRRQNINDSLLPSFHLIEFDAIIYLGRDLFVNISPEEASLQASCLTTGIQVHKRNEGSFRKKTRSRRKAW
jgi:hypothetical protein